MIRCTLDIIPFGIEETKRNIGTIEIANDGTGSDHIGNYNVKIKAGNKIQATGKVKGFKRLELDAYDLVAIAIKACE